jgi:hypothetical protein
MEKYTKKNVLGAGWKAMFGFLDIRSPRGIDVEESTVAVYELTL